MFRMKRINLHRKRNLIGLVLFVALGFILADSSQGQSFPFRALSIGSSVPDAQFIGYKGEEVRSVRSFEGDPLLLVFWGGDMEAKKKRAVNALKVLQDLAPYLAEKGIATLVVDMQNDSQAIVDEVTSRSGLKMPIYKDYTQEAYASFGLYVLPSILLIDGSGKVSGGLGYSKDLGERLRGQVDIMLGLISPEELEAQLNPVMEEVPEGLKLAKRHMKMGMVMTHKGMAEAALREFQNALKLDPEMHQARVKIGCLYLEAGALDDAIEFLEAGLEGEPDSLEAEICLARVSAKMGEVDDAIMDLKALLFRHSRDAGLHFTLGTMLEQQGEFEEASASYRKAYDLLQRKTMLQE